MTREECRKLEDSPVQGYMVGPHYDIVGVAIWEVEQRGRSCLIQFRCEGTKRLRDIEKVFLYLHQALDHRGQSRSQDELGRETTIKFGVQG